MSSEDSLVLLAGGDVSPGEQPGTDQADLVMRTLDEADFRFVQCERTFSRRGTFPDWTTIPKGHWTRREPECAEIFKAIRADVVSIASNHALDWGYEPLEDTIQLFHDWDIQVVGGGPNEAEARRPAIVEKDGIRIAILSYCSVLRDGQAAVADHPGIAGIRARTWYETIDFQPGCPPLVVSEAIEKDVLAMQADIRAAKQVANAVVVSMHWGVRFMPKVIATYQTPVAHAAIDAGADIIIGHHPHTTKAIEWYNGRVCLYSIGNFLTRGSVSQIGKDSLDEWNIYHAQIDPSSLYHLPDHCRRMVMPKLTFTTEGIVRVAMLPGYINELAQPRILHSDEELFQTTLEWLEWVSKEFPHEFQVEGNEIVVSAPK